MIAGVLLPICAQDKDALVNELRDRNPTMNVSQFKRDVRDGRLVQCCIELESHGDTADSQEFLYDYGLLTRDPEEMEQD